MGATLGCGFKGTEAVCGLSEAKDPRRGGSACRGVSGYWQHRLGGTLSDGAHGHSPSRDSAAGVAAPSCAASVSSTVKWDCQWCLSHGSLTRINSAGLLQGTRPANCCSRSYTLSKQFYRRKSSLIQT